MKKIEPKALEKEEKKLTAPHLAATSTRNIRYKLIKKHLSLSDKVPPYENYITSACVIHSFAVACFRTKDKV